jgi:hypothetical protein
MMVDAADHGKRFNHKGHKGTQSLIFVSLLFFGSHANAQAARKVLEFNLFCNPEDAGLAAEGTL